MDMLVVKNGEATVGFALHVDTLLVLEQHIPRAIEQGLSFVLLAVDDRGQTTQARIGPEVPYKFLWERTDFPAIDEERSGQIWNAIETGVVGLQIPAIDIDNMPNL